MAVEELVDGLPGYGRDIKLNFASLVKQNTDLTPQQLWGTVVVAAIATRNAELTAAAIADAANVLSSGALEAAKTAAAIMGMNNVYFRFQHLTTNPKYGTLRSRLRMNSLRSHGIEHVDFELWCTAVSAINACDACVDSHERALRKRGATEELINAAIRVASVVHAIGVILDSEKAAPAVAEAGRLAATKA